MRKILITGGAGFIGSHLVEAAAAAWPQAGIVVLDKLTYAADPAYIATLLENGRAELVTGDVCDFDLCARLAAGCGLVIHAAAESHVDRSFHSSILFTQTNALGTHTVMEACRAAGVPRIVHVSTDEVYGEVLSGENDETAELNPTNPYSASKAAAEMIVNGYRHSFRLPVVVVRANNIFGIRQFPEKLIPASIMALLDGRRIALHGDGSNRRRYLAAPDFAEALVLLAQTGAIGETYNVAAPEEHSNSAVARMICGVMGADFETSVEFVADRPFNDRRYAIAAHKIAALGWAPRRSLAAEMPSIVEWYRRHADTLRRRRATMA